MVDRHGVYTSFVDLVMFAGVVVSTVVAMDLAHPIVACRSWDMEKLYVSMDFLYMELEGGQTGLVRHGWAARVKPRSASLRHLMPLPAMVTVLCVSQQLEWAMLLRKKNWVG